MNIWIALLGLLAPLVGANAIAFAADAERTPATERCRDFCSRVYSETGDAYEECALACDDADACHRGCKEKFGEDRQKVHLCLRACMRRDTPPERAPAEAPVKL